MLCCAWFLSCVWLFVTPWTAACQAPLSMGILQARILEWVAMSSSRGSSQPRIETRSSVLQADSSPSEPPEKSMNTGVGSLSLLQGNFLTQEWIWGLLQWRWILYQLNFPGSPKHTHTWLKTQKCIGYSNRQLQFWSLLNVL